MAYRDSSFAQESAGTNPDPGVPTGAVSGDVLIAFVASTNQSITIPTPSGWTHVRELNIASRNLKVDIFRAAYNPTSTEWAPADWYWGYLQVSIVALSGRDTTTPISDDDGQYETGTSPEVPALTTVAGDDVVAHWGGIDIGDEDNAGSPLTNLEASWLSSDLGVIMGYEEDVSGTSWGPESISGTGGDYSACLAVAVAEAVAGGAMEGGAAGAATAGGVLAGLGALVAAAAGDGSAQGEIAGAGALVGASAGQATGDGELQGAGSIEGSAAGAATADGQLAGVGAIEGAAAGQATGDGALTDAAAGSGDMQGSAAGAATASGELDGAGALEGAAAGVGAADGEIVGTAEIEGAAAGVATVSGAVTGIVEMEGTCAAGLSAEGSYAEATVQTNPGTDEVNYPVLIDLSRLPSSVWDEVDTDDATKMRVRLSDGTRLAVDPFVFSRVGRTGWARVSIPSFTAAGTHTLRVYLPRAWRTSVAAGDTYGQYNAYNAGVVCAYPFEEDFRDRTRNQYHLTALEGSPVLSAGQAGNGVDLAGNNRLYNADVPTAYDLGELTVLAWGQRDTVADNMAIAATPNQGFGWMLAANNGSLYFWNDTSGSGLSSGAVSMGTGWQHYAATVDALNEGAIYFEGVQENTATLTGFDAGATAGLFLGSYVGLSRLWTQHLDEFQIHSVARSPAWVATERAMGNDQAAFWGDWTAVTTGHAHGTITGTGVLVGQAAGQGIAVAVMEASGALVGAAAGVAVATAEIRDAAATIPRPKKGLAFSIADDPAFTVADDPRFTLADSPQFTEGP